MNKKHSFLGTGWGFPPHFSKASKGVTMLSDNDDIKSSLEILLSTRLGERIMQPSYGCNLDSMLFEPVNIGLQTYIKDLVQTAIYYHEPRIQPDNVQLSQTEDMGVILLEINYTIRASNSRHNYVFPFYINEATLGKI